MKLYTIKLAIKADIINIFSTNSLSEAIQYETDAQDNYGKENVWICDNVKEIMVG